MNNNLIIILIVISFSLMLINEYLSRENFKNYLYPVKGLSNECESQGLKPAFMPTSCVIDNKMNPYSNCKCMNNKGECKVCYPEIKKDMKGRSIVYNANDFNKKQSNKKVQDYLNFNADIDTEDDSDSCS
jgi:hypothetical protein